MCIHRNLLETGLDPVDQYINFGLLFGQIFLMRSDSSELLSIYECVALSEINVNFFFYLWQCLWPVSLQYVGLANTV